MSDIPADTRPSRAKSARRAKRLGKVSIADYPTQWITDAKTARDAQAKLEAPSST